MNGKGQKIFEEIMAEIFLNLRETLKSQFQDAQ